MAARPLGDSYGGYRSRLVEQLRLQGIRDLAVLRAVGGTPRHLFVPAAVRHQAYEDIALPIGSGQTISQPSTQARFLEALALTGTERALEIGTGSGYQTALLSMLVREVVSVERVPTLAAAARQALETAGVTRTSVVVGDGSLGWSPSAPYDAIVVAAAGPDIPSPLVAQLADGGRMILPLDRDGSQEVWRVTRRGGEVVRQRMGDARFVPLIGKYGFDPGNR
ncbi:MAG: protein-L-isoaspartate(D-aspartate) O-methyltransferase [Gemmatimonadetes bacterium]|nr:protein-L-isoaspartate(D-aspartate) O-methyltransferase [Gemmatimonadota bacterium]